MADPIKPDIIETWANIAPEERKPGVKQTVRDNGLLKGDYVVNEDLNSILDNFSKNLIYLDFFTQNEFSAVLQKILDSAHVKAITGCDFSVPETGKTIVLGSGFASCKESFTPWYQGVSKFVAVPSGTYALINEPSGTDWVYYDGISNGIMAQGADPFAAGVTVYFFVFTDENDEYTEIIADTDVNGGNARTQFISVNGIGAGVVVMNRRLGANIVHNDVFDRLVAGYSVGGKFYRKRIKNIEIATSILPGQGLTFDIDGNGFHFAPSNMKEYKLVYALASDYYRIKGTIGDSLLRETFFSHTQREPNSINNTPPYPFKITDSFDATDTSITVTNDAGSDELVELDVQVVSWFDDRDTY
jgi:hypothetical protein